MILYSLTDEYIDKLVKDFNDSQRLQRIREYQKRYYELENQITNDIERVQEYFPVLYQEKPEQYRERVKLWVPWASFIIRRLSAIALLGVERKWVDIEKGETPSPESERANDLQSAMDEANDWDSQAAIVYYWALGLGEYSLWPEFRRFNKNTGEKYEVADGEGVTIWEGFFPWFVEPIVLQEYASEVIGAIKCVWLDNQYATPLLTQTIRNDKQQAIEEIYLGAQFSPVTGRPVGERGQGCYRKWVNNKPIQGDEERDLSGWWDKNHYQINPVVTFRAPDPDESSYRGKSYADRFSDIAKEDSHVLSNALHAIECMPNIWEFKGPAAAFKEFVLRRNAVAQIDADSPNIGIRQIASTLNLTEDWNARAALSKLIGIGAQFPMSVFDELPGKVESGVALKILFQATQDAITSIRKELSRSEKQRMKVAIAMFNAHNPNKKIDISKLRPEVIYQDDFIPEDEAAEFLSDMTKVDKGIYKLEDMIMKWNDGVTTTEQAKTMADEKRAELKSQMSQQQGFSSFRDKFKSNPNTETKPK